ncbi:aromatic-ring-hydroxylating dioxygenase subunit beta [Pseudonocardia sp. WMMC193]|uniref:aromatic-ring-hydroxylating dioxygenase subunit beta n=1 Tax=Pseudonocardia sp. WMMC193 TaxID=2911965 RepID=UPI001F2794E0|nr:aromatic-ring-hydroxylating dioxygenase subunit beta [Pseudonocardia sp. WMMC193]MCF7550884.1 aromatic-ring-hydroxylating dioxygenase subunit beta [Pseudonocardia sp. WMMC193]
MTVDTVRPAWSSVAELTRAEVEDFLYREAELLDDWDLDGWLTLFTEDARYYVPCNDTPDGDPARHLMLIDDTMFRLRSRVERLNSRKAHREYPHSNTSHQVHNVRLGAVEDGPDGLELTVRAEFTVWRFRGDRSLAYVGRYTYRLRTVDGEPRIVMKHCRMANTTLRQVADVAIIL